MNQIYTLLFLLFSIAGITQSQGPSPIVIIYDASGSMWGQIDGETKMEIASAVVKQTVEQLPDEQSIGLVAYGHRNKEDCADVETLLEMNNQDKSAVITAIRAIKPLGKTPLALSARKVVHQLKESGRKATIILITDGVETCEGDICDIVRSARAEGIEFRMHIVGFGIEEGNTEPLHCAATEGDGRYYDASNAQDLSDVLIEATQSTVDEPAENFSVFAVRPIKRAQNYSLPQPAPTGIPLCSICLRELTTWKSGPLKALMSK